MDRTFYRAGDWYDPHVSLHVGLKIQFAGIVPVFLEFNEETTQLPTHSRKQTCITQSLNLQSHKNLQSTITAYLWSLYRRS